MSDLVLPPECPYSEDHNFEDRYDTYADGTKIYLGDVCQDCGLFIRRLNPPVFPVSSPTAPPVPEDI